MFWIEGEAGAKLEEIGKLLVLFPRGSSPYREGKFFGGDFDKSWQALFGPELLHHIEHLDHKIRSTYYTRSYL